MENNALGCTPLTGKSTIDPLSSGGLVGSDLLTNLGGIELSVWVIKGMQKAPPRRRCRAVAWLFVTRPTSNKMSLT
ncbi:hypothetical protein RDT67_14670 [Serratia fonticola]|uniref:Uncharacterized protein n=1 Tax=Serratia fonticola TaxID=47917 RepID=A0AAJ2D9T5_SERFO|nr:hypothetical protein [Serratia fonticola]MDQ9127673.1 hypothetical protein [Serratia fonticola]